jgi:hypothetical protein
MNRKRIYSESQERDSVHRDINVRPKSDQKLISNNMRDVEDRHSKSRSFSSERRAKYKNARNMHKGAKISGVSSRGV